ncbi:MAG: flagellar hook assembly protein FlgD [Hyphomicrobiales bacterium]|nr:flagellar hook assembly protein FlgD [Hyphomicrobiales bacterium]
MDVTATAATATQTALKTEKSSTLDYDSFLQLLIAQMKNQDPTAPMDSSQYVAQLASFSGVEQAVKTNAKLDELLASQTLAQADGLIGRTVTSEDGSVTGKIASIRVLSGSAAAVLEDGRQVTLGAGVSIA